MIDLAKLGEIIREREGVTIYLPVERYGVTGHMIVSSFAFTDKEEADKYARERGEEIALDEGNCYIKPIVLK